ncbi:GTPase IMAP family member 9-like [Mytilus trossulus]|uniref:GTPase IMAP family member 9-like n=1 Tax=Mytilus trossulus TaxID=6551 RepID=UPI00300737BC
MEDQGALSLDTCSWGNADDTGWACKLCTFVNQCDGGYCQACYGDRMQDNHDKHMDAALSNDDQILVWKCDECQHTNYVADKYCDMCSELRHDDIPITTLPQLTQHGNSTKTDFKWTEKNSPLANMEENAERRILLIGKTGSGKSATGNNILNTNVFHSAVSGESVTDKCQVSQATRFGRMITVVDTPGLFDTRFTNGNISNELVKCTEMILPGPHAVVLVTRIGRFTKEEQDTVQYFVDHFGEGVLRYIIILFTRKDDLVKDNISLDQFIVDSTPELKSLLYKCNNRYIAFDNKSDNASKEKQCKELFLLIHAMLLENEGHFFTNKMLLEAESNLEIRLMQIAKVEKEKQNEEINKIKRKERRKMRKELDSTIIETDELYCLKLTNEWETEDKNFDTRNLEKEKERLENELKEAKQKLNK